MKTPADHIVSMDFAEEMKNSYRDYALSVIIARALPDVRDGLKPVQRRILYAMNELGLDPDKPHRKCARIVGDTMGKFHPHGDSSIYDALVHMTESYSLSIPLVDGHGNFGSIDGDSAAAMRYTEARLSPGAVTLLEHIEKGLVDFIPNFDESEKEPTVLPAMLPNLLINGTTGIAVGMATNIPPHNPSEVIDGVIAYINNPEITTEELMQYIPGPDFPTGGTIINSEVIPNIYRNGEGKLKVRAKTVIENSENGRKNIVITEVPYTIAGNKTRLVENLVVLMKDKIFDEIYDVRDESSKEGIRVVVEVKKDRDIDNLLNGLYKKTPMEDTYGVNLLAVKEQQPIIFSLKRIIQEFVTFQNELYTKEYNYLLDKVEKRLEIVSGLIRATDVIDLIIEILRGSTSVKQAKECLIHGITTEINFKSKASEKAAAKLDFTDRQADAILSMPLSKLIGLEIIKLHEENDSLLADINKFKKILGSQTELFKVMKHRLMEYRKKFHTERHTKLLNLESSEYVEDVKVEDIFVLIDRFGYTKSIDSTSYGRSSAESLKEYVHTVRMRNNDKLCLFTAEGNLHQIKAAAIPRCKLKDKGTLIQNLCKIAKEEILLYTPLEDLLETQLLFTTKNGFIKLVSGIEFETNRLFIAATKLDAEDKLIGILALSAADMLDAKNQKVILLTEQGLSLGFPLEEVSEYKKTSKGVKAIALTRNDHVAFAAVLSQDSASFEFEGKELSAKKVRLRKRGSAGQKANLT